MAGTILFSVVIPTCNRTQLLELCLNSLAPENQTLSSDLYEVIVTDDGNIPEEAVRKKKYPWVKWVKGPSKGAAANRNNGARYAKGSWIVFVDDDCIPDKDWLEGYAQALKNNPGIKVFEGKTYVDIPRKSLADVAPLNTHGGYLWSCNFSIQAGLLNELGGFNELFPYAAMEDVELRTRIVKAGNSFLFVPDASVMHPWRNRGGWQKNMEHQKSTFIYLDLHPEESDKINSSYYLRKMIRQLIKITIPGLFKYQGRGWMSAMLEHAADVRMVFILLFKRHRWGKRKQN